MFKIEKVRKSILSMLFRDREEVIMWSKGRSGY